MKTIEELCREIKTLCDEWDAPFPREGSRSPSDLDAYDLVMLDSDIAGCVGTFLLRDYTLDLWRTAILGRCNRAVVVALPTLNTEEAVSYYTRWGTIADLVLQVVERKAKEAGDTGDA